MKEVLTRRHFLKKSSQIFAAASLGGFNLLMKGCSSKRDFDIIIKNGYIFDGLGDEAFKADLGISENFIKEIGEISIS